MCVKTGFSEDNSRVISVHSTYLKTVGPVQIIILQKLLLYVQLCTTIPKYLCM
jgi:hypothetical protein